ncbi:MAG: hypothetical protein HY370_02735 [Proteobacteria bacterium]|nr:hypothetical protein [Pseudomonadota bacterium]
MPDRFLGWWDTSKDPRRADVGMRILPGGIIEHRVHDPGGELTMRDEYKILSVEGNTVYLALRRETLKPSEYYYPYAKIDVSDKISGGHRLTYHENACHLTPEEFLKSSISPESINRDWCEFSLRTPYFSQ